MRSSHIVTSVIGGLLVTLVACSQPRAGASTGTEDVVADSGSSSGETGDAAGGGGGGGDTGTDPDGGEMSVPDATVLGFGGSDACETATPVPLGGTPRVDLLASTTGASHDIDVPCSSGDSPDVFYRFAFSKPVFIYADTFGASWNTALFLLSDSCTPLTTSTTPGDAICSEGACGTTQSQIVARLDPGYYKLGLSGKGGAKGAATIHFEWTLAGSGNIAPLPRGTSSQLGTTVGGGGNIDGLDSTCTAAGAEDSYWWARCPSDPGGALSASTCGGATWKTVVDAQIPNGTTYKCSQEAGGACGLQSNLHATIPAGAGLAVVSVDGQGGNDFGDYTLSVTRP